MNCPLDCPHLLEAHEHERVAPVDPDQFPHQDIRVTDEFLRDHEALLVFLAKTLADAALQTEGAIDYDLRDALDALVRTYRTLQSGVYYETRPTNALAARICDLVQDALERFRRNETEKLGVTHTRDSEVLGVLAFLQRLELARNNGRARGRAFLSFLLGFFPESERAGEPVSTSLILP